MWVCLTGLRAADESKVVNLLTEYSGLGMSQPRLFHPCPDGLHKDATHLVTSQAMLGKTEKLQAALARGNVVIVDVKPLLAIAEADVLDEEGALAAIKMALDDKMDVGGPTGFFKVQCVVYQLHARRFYIFETLSVKQLPLHSCRQI